MPDAPLVSVIIPVLNDSARLRICLEVLARQEPSTPPFEIIVVDNGSSDDPASVVARFPRARFLVEPRPAADRARNAGLRAAAGTIIAFTDADCAPHPDWIARGVQALERLSRPGLVAGRIDVTASQPEAPTLAEMHDLVLAFQQKRCVRRSHYGATANLFTLRQVFDAVGPFRDDYGGDAEWGERVWRSGRQVVYSDVAVVEHPARRTVAELAAQTRRGALELVGWRQGRPLLFLRDELKDLVLPPDKVWRIASSPALPDVPARVRVLLLFTYLRQVRFWERLRLILLGVPDR